ncbi:MAG: bifunctional 3-demethylubiquinol 3-O-methyltransferase/2-polyprenyl-6-hydroxyphenol methylase [Alcanivorax sp.]|uniref:bifunctional 2-polyprenyl-6-hydroxyphenol methylase/3-demethylubiquinol 3-O-methyltransferase UbiG n=1 Tax=unclassified Ketobacter TaxID=2639109 RepID=UPI000F23901C|nr:MULTISPECIES: bifunctional 2-polyprenyl-6-hydroxyphenol methylase/3-demethylubiquinol 3-O-methyltransferase UbiG [unclassified Ketobacter]MEC8810612.1 bifunctional 2-polyprenyl-6-hydroxyphenol methylase/3-demethylubiquinol 3-O-methyltransferase UbiG [Pseudomonadota bacterium]RLT88675.1 MAG: bifunctional 2-polyprenyl-6-hydroxyphenol methylase/3-demethylubiquinol 3-O-methyltransferase UbiG [Ketobacter sp. GenoA1]RLT97724.1 MAG: bifunctional 2-polyprenyl-6-hydroxyphenol methylase/3-demethylubiqu
MSNVDQTEIAKFESIADKWWDPDGEFKPLHDINPLRLNYINERTALAGMAVLDVGCGGGILSEGLTYRGAQVTGIDMGAANLDVAQAHAAQHQLDIDYRHISVEDLAAEMPNHFDVVTCMEMLEHVPDPGAIVQACAALTKPGGHVFFSTINRNPKAYVMAIVGAEYVMKLVPKGTHEYLKFIKPSELSAWSRQAGLNVRNVSGMSVNPLSMHFKITKDVDVNYFVHCTKPA